MSRKGKWRSYLETWVLIPEEGRARPHGLVADKAYNLQLLV